jgi:hypothetical protein
LLGLPEGLLLGLPLGEFEADAEGLPLGEFEADAEGLPLGEFEADAEGLPLGEFEGEFVGDAVPEVSFEYGHPEVALFIIMPSNLIVPPATGTPAWLLPIVTLLISNVSLSRPVR